MDVHWISTNGIERHDSAELPDLLSRTDGFVWVDLPECDEHTAKALSEIFGFHPLAVRDCLERTHVPKVHAYSDHLFVILHAAELGNSGHVHLLELDQFVGRHFLVTVHGPLGIGVPLEVSLRETRAVQQRIASGRYRPKLPAELSYAVVTGVVRHLETLVAMLATRIAALERRVIQGTIDNPDALLEAMFHLRHELLTVRTIAAHSREVYARIVSLAPRFMPAEERPFMEDLVDQFDRIRSICDSEHAFLQGVIDFFQTRTITRLNVTMERLALLSALLLPVTAVASIYGMNIIVFERTNMAQVIGVLTVLGLMIAAMFWWARRHGWW